MYDYLSLRVELPAQNTKGEATLGASPAFERCLQGVDKQGWPVVRANYKNLRIEYKPGRYHGYVRGSLHSFLQGSNVGAFTVADVGRACSELAAALCLPAEAFEVRRMEVGVNLASQTSPREFLDSLVSHKQKPFTALSPPAGETHPLELEACYGSYRPKYYDKGRYEAKQGRPLLPGQHLMRFEVKFTRAVEAQKVAGRARLTLADLPASGVWAAFSNCLLKHWNLTTRRPKMDYRNMSFDDGLLLQSVDNLAFWEAMKAAASPSTYKRKRARLRQLLAAASKQAGPHPYDTLIVAQIETLNNRPAC
jgi:hypothetical protein